jgi:dihydrofolate reductase
MAKVIVAAFVSLDGVMQAPGGPDEDTSGGFRYGGWVFPHADDVTGAAVDDLFARPFDLLLGRRTYDIFASYWAEYPDDGPGAPIARAFNASTKRVATHRPETLDWANSKALGPDVPKAIAELKVGAGPDLVVQGSSELVHLLLAHDLVDELRLQINPVLLGQGKRLFAADAAPGAWRMEHAAASPSGVIIARHVRDGEVKTGSFA